MLTADSDGRPYVKLKGLRKGTRVQVDGGFTCLPAGAIRTVLRDKDGAYIRCKPSAQATRTGLTAKALSKRKWGRHYLDGQCDDEHCIGVYRADN